METFTGALDKKSSSEIHRDDFGTGSCTVTSEEKPNQTSLPAVKLSTLAKAAQLSATPQYEDRLLHLIYEVLRATVVENQRVQKIDPSRNSPSVTEEDAKFILRRYDFKKVIDVTVNNLMTLIDAYIISAL